jgi:multidrug transporter EmrE-like cation transporter
MLERKIKKTPQILLLWTSVLCFLGVIGSLVFLSDSIQLIQPSIGQKFLPSLGIISAIVLIIHPYLQKAYGPRFLLPVNFFQIYFVEAQKVTWTRRLTLISILAGIVGLNSLYFILYPQTQGELFEFRTKIEKIPYHVSYGSMYLILRTENGEKLKLWVTINDRQELLLQKAKERNDYITVWFREDNVNKYRINKIEYLGKVVLLTNTFETREVKVALFDKVIVILSAVYICLTHIVVTHKFVIYRR